MEEGEGKSVKFPTDGLGYFGEDLKKKPEAFSPSPDLYVRKLHAYDSVY